MIEQLRGWVRGSRPAGNQQRWALGPAPGILLISGGVALIVNVSLLAWLDQMVLRLLSALVPAGGALPPLAIGILLVLIGGVLVLYRVRGARRSLAPRRSR